MVVMGCVPPVEWAFIIDPWYKSNAVNVLSVDHPLRHVIGKSGPGQRRQVFFALFAVRGLDGERSQPAPFGQGNGGGQFRVFAVFRVFATCVEGGGDAQCSDGRIGANFCLSLPLITRAELPRRCRLSALVLA